MSDDGMRIDLKKLNAGLAGIGYHISMTLIILSVMPGLILASVVGVQEGFGNHFSYECTSVRCQNPWHEDYNFGVNVEGTPEEMLVYSNTQYFEQGFRVGKDKPPLLSWAYWAMIAFPILALVLNHFLYNRSWRPKK